MREARDYNGDAKRSLGSPKSESHGWAAFMILICPSCRAPSNTSEANCWVCRRKFDGSEPVIGEMPGARRPYRLADILELEAQRDAFDTMPWHRVRAS